jgi:ACS family tartrate transporter-like MFS transporter
MVLYLTYWFPKSDRGRFTAAFIAASPISNIVGGPLSGILLGLNGVGGLHGWQWLFLLEGAPACLLAFVTLRLLPDGPRAAAWLSAEEKETVLRRIGAEENTARGGDHQALWPALRDPRLWLCGFVMLGTYTALFGYVLWLPQIVQGMGFSNRATGFVVAIPYVASTIAMIVWGRSSDRHKERIRHVAGALLFAAAGFIAASLAGANLLVLAALTVAAMGAFAMLGPFYSLLSSFLRGTAAAGGIAFVNAVGTGLGGFLGPSAIGLLKQGTGGYASGLAALGFALMLSAALVLALGRSMAPRAAISLSKT